MSFKVESNVAKHGSVFPTFNSGADSARNGIEPTKYSSTQMGVQKDTRYPREGVNDVSFVFEGCFASDSALSDSLLSKIIT